MGTISDGLVSSIKVDSLIGGQEGHDGAVEVEAEEAVVGDYISGVYFDSLMWVTVTHSSPAPGRLSSA